jgi:hypothetical protein
VTGPISPAELLRSRLAADVDPAIVPGGVVVGPTTDEQQQQGCVSIMDAGLAKQERYLPLVRVRTQVRVMGPSLSEVDRIARHVYGLLNGVGRHIIEQVSTGEQYLIHLTNVSAGPSAYFNSTEAWEEVLFTESLISTDPVFTP